MAKILRTKQDVMDFVESLSPDEAEDVLKQLAAFNEEMEGFTVEKNAARRRIVKPVPKSNKMVQ